MRRLILAALLPLAACATPREACEADATRELRTIEALIAETERDLARGYRIVREPGVRTVLVPCTHPDDAPWLFCDRLEPTVTERPEAVDPAALRRTLEGLRERRAGLQAPTRAALAQCAAAFPQA